MNDEQDWDKSAREMHRSTRTAITSMIKYRQEHVASSEVKKHTGWSDNELAAFENGPFEHSHTINSLQRYAFACRLTLTLELA